jgi:FixJ family two-component response regulator
MSGVEFLEELTNFESKPYESFVYITGFAEVSKDDALKMGAKRFFSKPLDLESFLDDIGTLI